jgi:uncharacterized protein with NRDE domain
MTPFRWSKITPRAKERCSLAVTYGPKVPGWASVSPLDVSRSCEYGVLPTPHGRRARPPSFLPCIQQTESSQSFSLPLFLYSGACLPTYRTNITEPGASYASSRGTLLAAFLADPRGDSDLASATTALTAEDTSYAGFNLLLLEPHPRLPTTGTDTDTDTDTDTATLAYDARLVTNGGGGGHIRARTLSDDERACGGMSNGVDGQGGDVWPKVLQGRAALRSILDEGPADGPKIADADSHLAERLMELLTCVTASRRRVVIQYTCSTMADVFIPSRSVSVILPERERATLPPRVMGYEPENL